MIDEKRITRRRHGASYLDRNEKEFSLRNQRIGARRSKSENSLTSFLVMCALARNLQDHGKDTTSDLADAMPFSLERYWKLKEAERLAPAPRYNEELLWANWNPEVPSLLQSDCANGLEPAPQQSKPDSQR